MPSKTSSKNRRIDIPLKKFRRSKLSLLLRAELK
jgi:hypothetical protein